MDNAKPSRGYRLTWLGNTETFHPALGRLRPGASRVILLTQEHAEAFAKGDDRAWSCEPVPLPKGRARSQATPFPPLAGWTQLTPEAHIYASAVAITVSEPFTGRCIEHQLLSPQTFTLGLDDPMTPQLGKIKKALDLRRTIDSIVRDLFKRFRQAFDEWATQEGLNVDFRSYHAIGKGGWQKGRRRRTRVQLPQDEIILRMRQEGKTIPYIFQALHPGQECSERDRKKLERRIRALK